VSANELQWVSIPHLLPGRGEEELRCDEVGDQIQEMRLKECPGGLGLDTAASSTSTQRQMFIISYQSLKK
jgi:hypothetical protein